LVLAGDRDLLVSEDSLKQLCDGLVQSSLVRLAGCGHLAFVTQPHRVAEEIKAFLT
jgi:pimeloyl-ACP methyl ester carboxylesterase